MNKKVWLIGLIFLLCTATATATQFNWLNGTSNIAIDNNNNTNCTATNGATYNATDYPTYSVYGNAPGSYQFNGSNYYDCTNSSALNPSNTQTMAFWLKQTDMTGSTNEGYFGRDNGTARSYNIGDLVGGTSISSSIWQSDSTEKATLASDSGLSNNQWYCVVAIANGTTNTIYVDGSTSLTTPTAYDGTIKQTGINTTFGKAYNYYLNGQMSDIWFDSSAWNSTQITNYCNYGTPEGGAPLDNTTLSFIFKDQDTQTQITWANITIDLISNQVSYNFTTSTGNYTAQFITPTNYTMRYSANGYNERFYYFELLNQSYENLTLYLINSSLASNITITILDQNLNPLENARVEALKYDLDSNSYVMQEIGTTDANGETILSLTLNDEYYKFIVLSSDNIVLRTTDPAYITSTDLTIQVVTGGTYGEGFANWGSLNYNLTYNTATNNFKLDWADVSGITNNLCLYLYTETAASETQINYSCSSSASGTILLPSTQINGTYYLAKAYYTDSSGNDVFLNSVGYTYPQGDIWGNLGLIIQILFTITMAFLVVWSMPLAFIMTPLSLLLGRIAQLNLFPYEALIPIMILGVILAFVTSKNN